MSEINIFDTGTGWITPKGKIIGCRLYSHVTVIIDHDEVREIPEIEEIRESLNEILEGCEALAEAGEHPEWHCYEMAEDDARWQIWDILMREGFVRIGINSRESYIEAEGIGTNIVKHGHLIKRISREYGIAKDKDMSVITTRFDKGEKNHE